MVTVTGYQAKTTSEGERKIYLQVEGGNTHLSQLTFIELFFMTLLLKVS